MSQTGFTPIQLYRTATASAAPTAGNLADGELAINTNDGRLYYKDNLGAVQVIAYKNVPLSTVTGTLAVANGGTGATTAPNARTNLGATTVGSNLFTLTNPSAITFLKVNADNTVSTESASTFRGSIGGTTLGSNLFTITNPSAVTFPRFNADNTVSALDAATFRTAIGAGTGGGTVSSVSGTGTVNGITLTGTVTTTGSLTLGGTLSGVNLTSQVTGTLPVANGGTGVTTSTGSGNNVLSTSPTLVTPALGTPTSATLTNATGLPLSTGVTGTLPVANGGTGTASLTANNVLLGNGTSAVNFVAPGTNGNLLTSNGTTWTSAAPPASGAEILIATTNASGATSYDFFTSSFSNTYTAYKIIYTVRKTSASAVNITDNLRFYIDSSLRTTRYFYAGYQAVFNALNNSTFSTASSGSGTSNLGGALGGGDSTVDGVVIFGEIYLMNARGASNSTRLGGFWRQYSTYYGPSPYVYAYHRAINNNLTFSTGLTGINIDATTADSAIEISLYGVLR